VASISTLLGVVHSVVEPPLLTVFAASNGDVLTAGSRFERWRSFLNGIVQQSN
jgi:hypothetical protein